MRRRGGTEETAVIDSAQLRRWRLQFMRGVLSDPHEASAITQPTDGVGALELRPRFLATLQMGGQQLPTARFRQLRMALSRVFPRRAKPQRSAEESCSSGRPWQAFNWPLGSHRSGNRGRSSLFMSPCEQLGLGCWAGWVTTRPTQPAVHSLWHLHLTACHLSGNDAGFYMTFIHELFAPRQAFSPVCPSVRCIKEPTSCKKVTHKQHLIATGTSVERDDTVSDTAR
jgi:hypothetical protein